MLFRSTFVLGFILIFTYKHAALAQIADLDILHDPTTGVQIGVPRTIPGTRNADEGVISWKSDDGCIDLRTLRFPAARALEDIYQKIRSRKGRQITRDELAGAHFALEGSDTDGAQFVVQVQEVAGEKRGFSVTYRAEGRGDIASLARRIAASYKMAGDGAAPVISAAQPQPATIPITNVDGPTPKSEAELSHFQRQALQAQLASLGHKWPDRDGEFRSGTRAAIRSYQRTYGGPETGILTAQDINSLMQSGAYIAEITRLEGRDRFTVVDYKPLGKDRCDTVRADLDVMAKTARVSVDKTEAQAGSEIRLSWSFSPQQRRHPMYLMVTFDGPVRFSGKGYYVLMPRALAPFGLSHAGDRTRLVIPLYVTGGATSRTIQVMPAQAGSLVVDAAIVTPTGCGEEVASVMARTTLSITPGRPVIEIAEDIPADAVRRTILSPADDRRIEVTGDNTFRLVASATGQVIASLPGTDPRFSPAGRFVTAKGEEGVTVRDAIDGKRLNAIPEIFSWDNKDSFLLISESGMGQIEVRFPSVLEASGGHFALGCRPCSGPDVDNRQDRPGEQSGSRGWSRRSDDARRFLLERATRLLRSHRAKRCDAKIRLRASVCRGHVACNAAAISHGLGIHRRPTVSLSACKSGGS